MNHLTITYERLLSIFLNNKSNLMNNSIQRNVLEGALFHYIRDIEQNGRNSSRFLEFRDYFTDIDFRLSTASRLVQSVVQRTIDTPKTSKDGYIK